jgi:hypothetical protein
MVGWKQRYKQDPLYKPDGPNPLLTTLFSHELVGRPENQMTGVGFQFGGYHRSHGVLMDASGTFTVHRPEHWVFEGTKLKEGEEFGGVNKIVGYECDGCEHVYLNGKPTPTGRDGTPHEFEILATAPAQWPAEEVNWDVRWSKDR